MEKEKLTVRNRGRLRVWCLLLTDLAVLYGILAAVLCTYKFLGADYSLRILTALWMLPLATVLCNLLAFGILTKGYPYTSQIK